MFSNSRTVAGGGGLASEGPQDGAETRARLSEHAHLFWKGQQGSSCRDISSHLTHCISCLAQSIKAAGGSRRWSFPEPGMNFQLLSHSGHDHSHRRSLLRPHQTRAESNWQRRKSKRFIGRKATELRLFLFDIHSGVCFVGNTNSYDLILPSQ